METEIRYSVIVPVWNGEKTLRRCLNSLTCQNRPDVEILVIDDGSTDKTPEIIHSYAANHPNVIAIRQENGGVSRARNRGLALARGKYVTFVDSDDFVEEDYFAALDRAPEADLVVFRKQPVAGAAENEEALFARLESIESPAQRLALLLESRAVTAPWNKRFRTQFLREQRLRFLEDLDIGEDLCFCFAYALGCKSIGVLNEVLYRVDLSNDHSLSRRYRPDLDKTMGFVYRHVAALPGAESYGGLLDWQFARCALGCLAEECKAVPFGKLPMARIRQICDEFRSPLSPKRIHWRHKCLRAGLRLRLDGLLYGAAYMGKGRKWKKGGKGR